MKILKICLIATFSFLFSTKANALPQDFTCSPSGWYSGGFNIFYISQRTSSDGTKLFKGVKYWQATTGHGLFVGKPQIKDISTLQASIINGNVVLVGLSNSLLESYGDGARPLSIPQTWQTGSIDVDSELFYADVNWSAGTCVPGKDSTLP